jgi:hypothetical protein
MNERGRRREEWGASLQKRWAEVTGDREQRRRNHNYKLGISENNILFSPNFLDSAMEGIKLREERDENGVE